MIIQEGGEDTRFLPLPCSYCDSISMLKEIPYIPEESPAAFACSDASLAAL